MVEQLSHQRDALEILGPWVMNKGDELMLRAVVERLSDRFVLAASTDLKVNGQEGLPELPRVRWQPNAADLRTAVRRRSWPECLSVLKRGVALPFTPERVLRSQRMLNGRRIAALLDCSGFAYGDQWSPRRLIARTEYYQRLRQRGVQLIMLPQALGPFSDPEIRPHARHMLKQFDVIFPRETVSAEHVLDLGIDPTKVAACPDVSHLLAGRKPPRPEQWSRRVAIVPNARMLDKTDASVAQRYLDFLVICIERVRAHQLEPCILLHETNDTILLEQLLARLRDKPPVFDEDGVTSKGFLGCCYANLGSRYHSLVSSLCQATPSLGTSWAHKYEALFDEYGCIDCLISPALDDAETAHRLDTFLQPEKNQQLRTLLLQRSIDQSEKVECMWQQVEAMIAQSQNARISKSA